MVVPAYLRRTEDQAQLRRLLSEIREQSVRPHLVIVVDDCSPTQVVVTEGTLLRRQKFNQGPAAARNLGKRIAGDHGADIVAFTDVDCVPDPHWLETAVRTFHADRRFSILSGNTRSFDQGWLDQYHEINGTLNGRRLKAQGKLLYGTTANLAITRQVNTSLRFDTSFPSAAGEDIEFCLRANRMGFAIRHVQEMLVRHDFGYDGGRFLGWLRFVQQFRKYASGEAVLLTQVPEYYRYLEQSEEISAET